MNVSILQMPVKIGERAINMETAEKMTACAMSVPQKPDVLVMPEMWDIGFYPKNLAESADYLGNEGKAFLSALAKKYHVNIVGGSISEKNDTKIHNHAYIFNREGQEVADYIKTHLFSHAGENKRFAAGNELSVFELDGIKCGIIICYELRFPELARTLAMKGIEILFIPAAWPLKRADHWDTLIKARAIENQFFVTAVNTFGHSVIVNPWGETISEEISENIISASIDMAQIAEVRNSINVYNDRRPELY